MDLKTLAALIPLIQLQAKRRVGLKLVELVLLVIVGVMALAMLGFLCVALFFAVEPELGRTGAALVGAGCLFVLILMVLLGIAVAERRSKAKSERERLERLQAVSDSGVDGLAAVAIALIHLLNGSR